MKNISVAKILKEQDEAAIVTVIVAQLRKLIRLYQIPNIVQGVDVELADWIYENYKYEEFSLVYSVLKNPPPTSDKNWRLTPDTMRGWMSEALEEQAARREREHHNLKTSDRDLKLFADDKEMHAIYEKLKMPARLKEEAKRDMQERFSPRKKFICDGIELYAIDESYARKVYRESFGKDPLTVKPADTEEQKQP